MSAEALNASEMIVRLRKRHQALWPGTAGTEFAAPGEWVCLEEWAGIDLIAFRCWGKHERIGYEVKVSRADLRRELLRPVKREQYKQHVDRLFLAVPNGLLKPEELAWEQPADWTHDDFRREECPGVEPWGPLPQRAQHARGPGDSTYWRPYGGACRRMDASHLSEAEGRYIRRKTRDTQVRAPLPVVAEISEWERERIERGRTTEAEAAHHAVVSQGRGCVTCTTCGGTGYLEKSKAEREAPTLWVPPDVGLVVVTERGTRVVRKAPQLPEPRTLDRKALHDLVRWASFRSDPRHCSCAHEPLRSVA